MGLIFGYADLSDEEDDLEEALHHEIAHALRAHSLGWVLGWIGVNDGPNPETKPKYGTISEIFVSEKVSGVTHFDRHSRSEFHFSHDEQIQVSLAGPLASIRYYWVEEKALWPPIEEIEGESNTELLDWLNNETIWKYGRQRLRFKNLDWLKFRDAELLTDNDYSQIFDSLIAIHHARHYRIPTKGTILRQFRRQEKIARAWVINNWSTISALAQHVLDHPRPNDKYSHYLSAANFYKWIHK